MATTHVDTQPFIDYNATKYCWSIACTVYYADQSYPYSDEKEIAASYWITPVQWQDSTVTSDSNVPCICWLSFQRDTIGDMDKTDASSKLRQVLADSCIQRSYIVVY